jgi:hypothetical protein
MEVIKRDKGNPSNLMQKTNWSSIKTSISNKSKESRRIIEFVPASNSVNIKSKTVESKTPAVFEVKLSGKDNVLVFV